MVSPAWMPGAVGVWWQPRFKQQVWVQGACASGHLGTRTEVFHSQCKGRGAPGPGVRGCLAGHPNRLCAHIFCMEDSGLHGGKYTRPDVEQTCESPRGRTLGRGAPRDNLQKGSACS